MPENSSSEISQPLKENKTEPKEKVGLVEIVVQEQISKKEKGSNEVFHKEAQAEEEKPSELEKKNIASIPKETQEKIDKPFQEEKLGNIGGLSIKGALQEKQVVEVNEEIGPSDAFDQNHIDEIWKIFLNEIEDASTKSVFQSISLIKSEKQNEIIVESPSYTIQSEWEEVQRKFIGLAKGKLNNFHLAFDYRLKELEKKDLPESNKDIFEKMADKNPEINRLLSELGLDFND